ncbi:MAG: acyl-CoA thioesterase II [Hahellaceae bacterium]|nr:acyl-CoA thioesterase II [Hahellaceae bacterium]MCP5210745.1 acyl-CoA thioesterase II [Hahellaceae bacterium]
MTDVLHKLIGLLDIEPIAQDQFLGESEDLGFRNVFGGQVLGQAMMAACKTVEDRLPHSMHGYFLRAGDPAEKIQYKVDRIRDGSSFATRRVLAIQHGKEIFTLTASFQQDEVGFEHQFSMPTAASPEGLMSEVEMRRKIVDFIPEKLREQATCDRPIEIRPVAPLNYFRPEKREPYKQNWFKAISAVGDNQVLHRCLLAYASDFGLLGTGLLPHGVTYYSKGMQVASLDHAIWFHRDFRIDDWLLYDMDSPSASQGRGFNRGNIYNTDGVLVASVCQEALIRRHPKK